MALAEASAHEKSVEFPGLEVEGDLALEGEEEEESEETTVLKRTHASRTPVVSHRDSFGGESLGSATKRRGRPKGWTDAKIHAMLNYLERNMAAYKSTPHIEFYTSLCANLGFDMTEVAEIQDKAEKMVKKYENDTRRGDSSWKWYSRLNSVFGGPPIYGGAGMSRHHADDDAASSSMESEDDDELLAGGEPKKRVRGEDPFLDRLEHEKLLLKLKKLKSKTEMRHREWEAAAQKQAQAFEELKAKTASSIARLEKSIVNAGYLLDQADIIVEGAN